MKNENLAAVFDKLAMPAMARRARSEEDLSRSLGALIWYAGTSEIIRGEAILVKIAAEKDGYSPDLQSAFMATQWIKMPYSEDT